MPLQEGSAAGRVTNRPPRRLHEKAKKAAKKTAKKAAKKAVKKRLSEEGSRRKPSKHSKTEIGARSQASDCRLAFQHLGRSVCTRAILTGALRRLKAGDARP